jgi:hypothetical protein
MYLNKKDHVFNLTGGIIQQQFWPVPARLQ